MSTIDNIIIKDMETPEERYGKSVVHYRSWQHTYRGLIPQEYLDAMSVEKSAAITERYPDDTLIAIADDTVIGFAGYGPARDQDLVNAGEVYAIYVLPEYQHMGAGYALMQEAVRRLAAYDCIAVWALGTNQNAIEFYHRYGFVPDGQEKTTVIGQPVREIRMIYER